MSFRDAFDGKRVLLTGHTGFKGSWLSVWLHELGAEVHGYSTDPPTTPSMFADAGIDTLLASDTRSDVRDLDTLVRVHDDVAPDVVMHLAAQPLVRDSYANPVDTFSSNVMGTAHVLDAVRRNPVARAVLIVTTDKCYENSERPQSYREQDPMGGHDPYSASKGAAELVTASYRRSFFSNAGAPLVASARAGNVIGGGDWSVDRLVPDCIRALRAGETITLRNPGATRPWQHVLEPLSGYLRIVEQLLDGTPDADSAWNLGPLPTGNLSVGSVVDAILRSWGGDQDVVEVIPSELHEAQLLQLDIAKAVAQLDWSPTWSTETAVERTVEWYRAQHDQGDSFDALGFTRSQITGFERERR